MNKYEERCFKLAQEMALLAKSSLKWTHNESGIPYLPQEMHNRLMKEAKKLLPLARLSVQREAEAHEQGFRTGLRSGNTGIKTKRSDDLFNKGFISEEERIRCDNEPKIEQSNGLIPPKTETE